MSRIYHKFLAKDLNSNDLVEYRVEDVAENHFEEVVDFLVKYFIPDEPMTECLKISENPEGVQILRTFFLSILEKKASLICFKEGSQEIVATNVMSVQTKAESEKPDEVFLIFKMLIQLD
jgi:hypothetical protein